MTAGVVACILEANPTLSPKGVREGLIGGAQLVPGASAERQGAGVLHAGHSVRLAIASRLV